jgi:C-terminal processing protease CtpA/Prc
VACGSIKKSNYNPYRKIPPQQLQSDFTLLQKILEYNHPSLYWYTPKDSVDYYFKSIQASLKDSLTELQFKNRIAWTISKIHCGHTVVRNSKKYTKYFSNRRIAVFPLSLKVWPDSAVVVHNFLSNDSVLKRGTIITGINNRPIKKVLDSICQLIGSDGYAYNLKYQLISFNFPAYYRNTFGVDSQYVISYINPDGIEQRKTVRNYDVKTDTFNRGQAQAQHPLTKKELRKFKELSQRNLTIDTASGTAYLSVNTFSEGKLKGFFRRSFRKIKDEHLKNVVIDLRQNSGGNILWSTSLCQYLVNKPFNVADTVAANTRSFPYKKYMQPWLIYWLSMHTTAHRNADGRIHFRYFERHQFKPKNKNHFNGNIYLVTGGYTFSAAALVTGTLKGQPNVTVVGEETGGGAYGNSAMHLPTIELPNSGIRVTLPLYRLVIDAKHPKNGRGIFPDVEVLPSSDYIRRGVDGKMEKVKQLITAKTHVASLQTK